MLALDSGLGRCLGATLPASPPLPFRDLCSHSVFNFKHASPGPGFSKLLVSCTGKSLRHILSVNHLILGTSSRPERSKLLVSVGNVANLSHQLSTSVRRQLRSVFIALLHVQDIRKGVEGRRFTNHDDCE